LKILFTRYFLTLCIVCVHVEGNIWVAYDYIEYWSTSHSIIGSQQINAKLIGHRLETC